MFATWPLLSVILSGISSIHSAGQPPPLSTHRAFHRPKRRLHTQSTPLRHLPPQPPVAPRPRSVSGSHVHGIIRSWSLCVPRLSLSRCLQGSSMLQHVSALRPSARVLFRRVDAPRCVWPSTGRGHWGCPLSGCGRRCCCAHRCARARGSPPSAPLGPGLHPGGGPCIRG